VATFAYNSSNGATSVTATRKTVTLQLTDETGAAISGATLSGTYWLNDAAISSGTGSTDTLLGTSGNDLVLWDDLTETSSQNPFGASRYGTNNSSSTARIEYFGLGDGNDVFAFNYSSASSGVSYTAAVTVSAGTGNDVIWSSNGADFLYGDYGRDQIYGGGGADVIAGDQATDTNVTIPGGAASNADTIFGGSGNDTIWGDDIGDVTGEDGGGNDTLYGGSGNDTIYGGANDDIVVGGSGTDYLYGGGGFDLVDLSDATSGLNLTLTAGPITLNIGGTIEGFEGFIATSLSDVITTDSVANLVFGGAGNDTLTLGGGNDTAFGGSGNDQLFGGLGDDFLDGGLGNDVINGGGGLDIISYASATAAVVVDATGGTEMQPQAAVTGGAGVDNVTDYFAIEGSDYADTMSGGNNFDVFYGGVGADTLTGGAQGADTMFGGDGNDLLSGMYLDHGGGLEDTLYGGNGDDVMIFSSDGTSKNPPNPDYGWTGESSSSLLTLTTHLLDDTSDYFYGGAGNDTLDASRDTTYTNGVYIHAGKDPAVDWIMSVEYIIATNNNDVINLTYSDATGTSKAATGNSVTVDALNGNDVIVSGAGLDSLYGGNGADTIYGGDGNDRIFGGSRSGFDDGGDDRLFGGDGDDVITDTSDAPLIMGGIGNDTITATEGLNSTIYGGDGNDLFDLTYNATSSTLYGGLGDDVAWVDGNYSYSTVEMGDGNDWLVEQGSGGLQSDTVWGGAGDDIISIFAGNDTAWGGSGVDVIWSGAGNDTIYGGDGNDHLYGGEFGNTGDRNYIYGGVGEDVVYVSRDDGTDYYFGGGDGRNDEVVMFGRFALETETPVGGWFSANTGVSENNGNGVTFGQKLGSDSDSDITINYVGTQATMVNKQTGATIVFSTNDVQAITLWNSDANHGAGQRFEEVFEWNATQNAYTFDHYA
jgi:Ca2+-binding RTX toxin-like protein